MVLMGLVGTSVVLVAASVGAQLMVWVLTDCFVHFITETDWSSSALESSHNYFMLAAGHASCPQRIQQAQNQISPKGWMSYF